jgi:outer membrane protein
MSDRRLAFAFVSSLLALFAVPLGALAQTADEPLTLPRAVAMALAHAPEVAVAQADSDLAAASARLAQTHYGPEAYVATIPGYSTGLPVLVAGQVPSLLNVSVRQPIYDASLRAGALDARAAAEERQSAFERVRADTARAVVLAFGRVAADGTLLAGARRALEAQEAMARRASSLAAEGRDGQSDGSNGVHRDVHGVRPGPRQDRSTTGSRPRGIDARCGPRRWD